MSGAIEAQIPIPSDSDFAAFRSSALAVIDLLNFTLRNSPHPDIRRLRDDWQIAFFDARHVPPSSIYSRLRPRVDRLSRLIGDFPTTSRSSDAFVTCASLFGPIRQALTARPLSVPSPPPAPPLAADPRPRYSKARETTAALRRAAFTSDADRAARHAAVIKGSMKAPPRKSGVARAEAEIAARRRIANFRAAHAALLSAPADITAELNKERAKANDLSKPLLIEGLPNPEPVRRMCARKEVSLRDLEAEIDERRARMFGQLDAIQKGVFVLMRHAAVLEGIVRNDGLSVGDRLNAMAGRSPVPGYDTVVQQLQALMGV